MESSRRNVRSGEADHDLPELLAALQPVVRRGGVRRIVPVSWTSLVPRVVSRLADGRGVRIGPEVALELTRWIAPRLDRGEGAGKC